MRMWCLNPKMYCRQHLLGSHVELHMILACIVKGKSLQGYIDNNLIQPMSLEEQHHVIVQEMIRRGYNHHTPLYIKPRLFAFIMDYYIHARVDKQQSFIDLITKCTKCANRYFTYSETNKIKLEENVNRKWTNKIIQTLY